MTEFRKKPVIIEAFRFGLDKAPWWWISAVDNGDARVHEWHSGKTGRAGLIKTLEGEMWAQRGDWIIRGVAGELYPCKPDIFEATYEPAHPSTPVEATESVQ